MAETIFNILQLVIENTYLQAIKLMKRQIRILIERLSCKRMPTNLRILIFALTYYRNKRILIIFMYLDLAFKQTILLHLCFSSLDLCMDG